MSPDIASDLLQAHQTGEQAYQTFRSERLEKESPATKFSVHIVYYKDILSYQLHIIHRMGTSTLCTLSIHYVVYT